MKEEIGILRVSELTNFGEDMQLINDLIPAKNSILIGVGLKTQESNAIILGWGMNL